MRYGIKQAWVFLVLVVAWSCGPKEEPQPALPGYLTLPATLEGYKGSGLVTINGGTLNLRAEGPERLDPATNTYSGVLGDISGENVDAYFTFGQPRPYGNLSLVSSAVWAYGSLTIYRAYTPGTYPMGIKSMPTPRGEIADLTMNLPGPQLYVTNSGSLTVEESMLIKTEGGASLYRVRGTFQAVMYADGIGITERNPTMNGTFDLLLVRN